MSTVATVTRAEKFEDGGDRYRLEYRYRDSDGRDHTGNGEGFDAELMIESGTIRPGSRFLIFYDPEDPARSWNSATDKQVPGLKLLGSLVLLASCVFLTLRRFKA